MKAEADRQHRNFLILLIALLVLVGGFFGIRSIYFEQRNSPVPYASEAALENHMLAASRLLKQHGIKVKQVDLFDKSLSKHLPAGTLYLADVGGDFEDGQFKDMMQWVENGNTLIYRPRYSGKSVELSSTQACEQDNSSRVADDTSDEGDADSDTAPVRAPAKPVAKPVAKPAPSGPASGGGAAATSSDTDGSGVKPGNGSEVAPDHADAKPETESSAEAEASAPATESAAPAADKEAASTTNSDPDQKKLSNADPVSRFLDIELRRIVIKYPEPDSSSSASSSSRNKAKKPGKAKAEKAMVPCLANITWPQTAYPLELDHQYALNSDSDANLLFADKERQVVRVYQHGKGHIVALAQSYFGNARLPYYDHAQLLLHLVDLQKAQPNFTIVKQLKRQTWYQKLWSNFHLALITLGLGLLLLLWMNIRRFGSVLPMPEPNRRALLEHIDASSRWLWKMPGGRDILLHAARASTVKILQRRAPAIMRLPEAEQIAQLSATCSINRPDLVLALSSGAAATPLLFMRQIKTLQRLRKHYER